MEASKVGVPIQTGNLVLKTRIAAVTRNLKDMQSALAAVQQRRADLRQVLQLRGQVRKSVVAIRRHLDSADAAYQDDAYDEIPDALERITRQVSALEAAVQASDASASRLAIPLPAEDDGAAAIDSLLQNEIDEGFGGLDPLQTSVAARERMSEAWATYVDELYGRSEKLFAEYVELVGGLAIRDTGFDRGISRIADDLVKPFRKSGDHVWDSFAIPARQEALSLTAARIVRLGFPEWTIWTLPLAAHEFGHIFANWDERIRDYGGKGRDHDLHICFADAFATYVMGPAYACAALLMRLDPRAAFSRDDKGKFITELGARRVAVILGVLERMSTSGPRRAEDLYGPIIDRLRTEWLEALRQTDSAGSLTEAEEKDVEKWIDDFGPFVLARQLRVDHWPTIEEWATQLARGGVDDIDLKGIKELRYVLNAAWRARIAVKEGEKDVDDADAIRDIASAAEALWNRIEQPEPTSAEETPSGARLARAADAAQRAAAQNEPEPRT